MMNKQVALLIFFLFLSISFVHATVVFETYETDASIQKNDLVLERQILLRNRGQTPIIPGEIHFRLYEQDGTKQVPLAVSSIEAVRSNGQVLQTNVFDRTDETDIAVQIWDPLLPGFSYEFTLRYSIEFNPAGVLFHEITLPIEETTIPIQKETVSLTVDDGYYITYAPNSEIRSISGMSVVQWDGRNDQRVVEYSILPFPRTGTRGVNIFWLIIIVLLVGTLVLTTIRRRNMLKPPPQNLQPSYSSYHQPQRQQYHQHAPPQPPHNNQNYQQFRRQ